MAVYTDIDERELADFLARYPVGELLSYRGIAEGVENSNFLIHATDAAYILTLFERRVAEHDLPFFLGLKKHLAANGFGCPHPIERTGEAGEGAMLGRLAGRPAALVSFLEGVWLRRPTPAHCREAGTAMARLHEGGADFPMRRANALGPGAWASLYEAAGPDAPNVAEGLAETVETALREVERGWPTGLPAGIVHADYFPDNVFFLHDRVSGVIDFYFAANDQLAYDIAIALLAWCHERDGMFNATKGRAFLAGYESVRRLGPDEAEALPVLARGAALRFMLTRLYDWLHVPGDGLVVKKDPAEYLAKLRHHANVTSAAEYGLIREAA